MNWTPRLLIWRAKTNFRVRTSRDALGSVCDEARLVPAFPLRRRRCARVLNDALSIYPEDATVASAFMARWHVGAEVDTAGGVAQMREGHPQRVGFGSTGCREAERVRSCTLGERLCSTGSESPRRGDAGQAPGLARLTPIWIPDSAQEQKPKGSSIRTLLLSHDTAFPLLFHC